VNNKLCYSLITKFFYLTDRGTQLLQFLCVQLLVALTELMAGLLIDCWKMMSVARTTGCRSANEGIRRRER